MDSKDIRLKLGDKVWFVENGSLDPRHGVISQVITPDDKTKPISYLIDDDDMVHTVLRHTPTIFRTEEECKKFCNEYRSSIDSLIASIKERMGPSTLTEVKECAYDICASVHGRIETLYK